MGTIFTLKEVRDGHVPQVASLYAVEAHARVILTVEPSIVCIVGCGTVAHRTATRRSDCDLFVCHDWQQGKAATAALQRLDVFAAKHYAPVNYARCDSLIARTPLHSIGPSFYSHLQKAAINGGLIHGCLPEALARPTLSARTDVEMYVSRKLAKLEVMQAQWETRTLEERARCLTKAFEAPVHAARKVLYFRGILNGDSKREVEELYRDAMPESLGRQLRRLRNIDRWYSDELAIQLFKFDEEQYQRVLRNLEQDVPKVLEFLRGNLFWLSGVAP